ncbi:protein kinase family protein [Cellulomonas shaoxiangyii]|uniref:Protein kinase domain-containing protein n=1 Tax=Cellulomonas shaoxiangyii TaxID=2566013 RepID=A0A4P7SQR3_9CELL|nr:protein kinase family protein [Cellulomonas shaoxiangyii]QCB95053.1 hypothetical protein E5225_17280 [Cellulomonas shaoxiangyii]TGY86382.1 hypothetical protein E5226_02365 [Cellulomonas shaoxiangyii]
MAEVGRGTVLAGRYRVLEALPSDLDGVSVWKAIDQILDRPVRVRVLQSGDVGPALDAARRAALVTDARLVRVLDVGTHEGVGYVVSEQIVGASLAQLVEHGPLTADQARAVVGEAAAALEVARRRGVHHLALRPSVVHVSADGRVLISGLALDAALLGVPHGDAGATSRTDAVDLVRLLYTGLTGRWPAHRDGHALPTPGVGAAPVLDGAPVPPAELAPGVPNDLDTLCAVTLGSYEDGPHGPGDLVHELEPWGEIRVGRSADELADRTDGRGALTAAPSVPTEAEIEAATAPVRVPRQSVRTVFDEAPPGVVRPGTPPPAAPTRVSNLPRSASRVDRTSALPAAGAAATAAAGATSAAAAPTLPASLPPLEPADHAGGPPAAVSPEPYGTEPYGTEDDAWGNAAWGGDDGDPFPFDQDDEEDGRRRFDPTAVVLVVVGIVVLIGLVFAARALFTVPGGTDPAATQAEQPAAPAETEAPPAESAAPPPPAEPPAAGPPVVIGIRSLDASDADGEHEEAVTRAIDGDPGTYWFSQTYNRPDFAGLKDGVGLEVRLAAPAAVSAVTLAVNGSGGNVEVRATSGDAPTQGDVLASAPMGAQTALTFAAPVETDVLTVWFTELPTMPDGRFRIELTDLTLG